MADLRNDTTDLTAWTAAARTFLTCGAVDSMPTRILDAFAGAPER
jgi:hypothetical protein